jgi:hypothetical protein
VKLTFYNSKVSIVPEVTNITVSAGLTTTVNIFYDLSRAGTISGTVHTVSGVPAEVKVNATDSDSGKSITYDYSSSTLGAFLLPNVNPEKKYDITVSLSETKSQSAGSAIPGNKPLNIIVPDPVSITGAITDSEGNALDATVNLGHLNKTVCHGTFELKNIFPGQNTIRIMADGYLTEFKHVNVTSKDTDIGIIVLEKIKD